MGITMIVLGVICKAYASVVSVHDSTLAAMGSWTLKTAASLVGTVMLFFGILALFAGMAG